jgi:Polyketide cyclase / dehydrase and lipid transport
MNEPDSPPQLEVTINAPPEQVWRALRDPELLRRWHGWHTDDDALDEEVRVIYHNESTEDPAGFVLQLGDQDRFSLHPTDGGTVVRVTRPPRTDAGEWAAYYDDITEGWQTFIEQLRFAIERHQLAERRTLHLDGTLRSKGSIIAALGLSDVAALPPGSPYRAAIPTGEELTGQVWARRVHQLAVTVDGYGDGLLILAEQPRAQHRPDGGALVVLTAYGLDGAAFEKVRAGWSRWWASASQ